MGPTRVGRRWLAGAAAIIGLVTMTVVSSEPVRAADSCPDMSTTVTHLLRQGTGGDLLTTLSNEITSAAQYGYTEKLAPFMASATAGPGLVAVRRLYSPTRYDFTWATSGSRLYTDAVAQGYVDQEVNFYAAPDAVPGCTQPVDSYVKGGIHRVALREEASALASAGWTLLGTAFHVFDPAAVPPPAPVDTTFSFAVMPDTQNEVGDYDQRMPKRVSWLVKNKEPLDLRWVLHSGDVHNWDTSDHYQFRNMSTRLAPLSTAGLPYLLAAGNHDTAAVCPGGSACPGANTNVTVRNTSTWNAYYPSTSFGLEGQFEAGHSENGYRTFSAGGVSWLVLDLELWARPAVVSWARSVVASHPRNNVIVVTHSFLEANGTVSASNGGYGATAPSTLWAALDDFPNVMMIFSGHVGAARSTELAAADGHKVSAFLQALHARDNPVRIVEVDTEKGTITTQIRSSFDPTLPAGQQDVDRVYQEYSSTISGMRWVR